jgi:hypothetical protein
MHQPVAGGGGHGGGAPTPNNEVRHCTSSPYLVKDARTDARPAIHRRAGSVVVQRSVAAQQRHQRRARGCSVDNHTSHSHHSHLGGVGSPMAAAPTLEELSRLQRMAAAAPAPDRTLQC